MWGKPSFTPHPPRQEQYAVVKALSDISAEAEDIVGRESPAIPQNTALLPPNPPPLPLQHKSSVGESWDILRDMLVHPKTQTLSPGFYQKVWRRSRKGGRT